MPKSSSGVGPRHISSSRLRRTSMALRRPEGIDDGDVVRVRLSVGG
jgi:hypothetical protein